MTPVQVAALVLVAVGGTATVLVRVPIRQIVVAGLFGLGLAILFFVFSAPDVALSELTVSTVVVPAIVLLALARLRAEDEADERGRGGDGDE